MIYVANYFGKLFSEVLCLFFVPIAIYSFVYLSDLLSVVVYISFFSDVSFAFSDFVHELANMLKYNKATFFLKTLTLMNMIKWTQEHQNYTVYSTPESLCSNSFSVSHHYVSKSGGVKFFRKTDNIAIMFEVDLKSAMSGTFKPMSKKPLFDYPGFLDEVKELWNLKVTVSIFWRVLSLSHRSQCYLF